MSDDADRLAHAATFTAADVVSAYAARPSYPGPAVDWLTGPPPRRVLDLGAGNGRLTELLVAAGHDVVAVEPSQAMLEALRGQLPDIEAHRAGAEAIPLPAASVDVVTVAQALHWFDPEPALAEVARVLRPRGRVSVVYNVRDERDPAVRELSEVLAGPGERVQSAEAVERSARFGALEEAHFAYAQRLARAELAALVRSRSYVAIRPEHERAALLRRVDDVFDRHAVGGQLVVAYVTRCWRAERLP